MMATALITDRVMLNKKLFKHGILVVELKCAWILCKDGAKNFIFIPQPMVLEINDLKPSPLPSFTHLNIERKICRSGTIVVIETVTINNIFKIRVTTIVMSAG
jgi:hypothetical protein